MKEDLSRLTKEELLKKSKMLKFAVIALGASMLLMTVSGIIISIKKGFSALTVTSFGFFPLAMIFSMQLKKVKEELKKRNDLS